MVLPSFMLLFLVSQMVGVMPSRTVAEQFQQSANDACTLVGQATPVTQVLLQERIYRPLVGSVMAQLKELPPKPSKAFSSFESTLYTAHPAPEGTPDWSPSEADPHLMINVAGGVADTIIERYRESFRQTNEPVPMLVTFRSPGEDKTDPLVRITQDIQLYCGKLRGRGVEKLFPGLDRVGQPKP